MDLTTITRTLWLRRQLRKRERWTPEHLRAHQSQELARLRAFASERSPFYRRSHHGLAPVVPSGHHRLNELRPDVLVGYASMIRALAEEQLAGHLRIAPRAVNSSSEVLTPEARAIATRAWQVPPFKRHSHRVTGQIDRTSPTRGSLASH